MRLVWAQRHIAARRGQQADARARSARRRTLATWAVVGLEQQSASVLAPSTERGSAPSLAVRILFAAS